MCSLLNIIFSDELGNIKLSFKALNIIDIAPQVTVTVCNQMRTEVLLCNLVATPGRRGELFYTNKQGVQVPNKKSTPTFLYLCLSSSPPPFTQVKGTILACACAYSVERCLRLVAYRDRPVILVTLLCLVRAVL